jgi:Phorbol esters/diacylglycerol binding domain (C1 domain)
MYAGHQLQLCSMLFDEKLTFDLTCTPQQQITFAPTCTAAVLTHGHSYQPCLLQLPGKCAACGDLMWGALSFSKGCTCLTCGIRVHRQCATSTKVPDCPTLDSFRAFCVGRAKSQQQQRQQQHLKQQHSRPQHSQQKSQQLQQQQQQQQQLLPTSTACDSVWAWYAAAPGRTPAATLIGTSHTADKAQALHMLDSATAATTTSPASDDDSDCQWSKQNLRNLGMLGVGGGVLGGVLGGPLGAVIGVKVRGSRYS